MPYILSVFQTLKKQYPTWNDLYQKFFIEMYGNLRLITFEDNHRYVIIRYEKGKSDFSVPEVPYFRSVVWDTQLNVPVCVAPIKSNSVESSVNIQDVKGPAIIEEYIEGTMVNVFQAAGESAQLTTRTKLGANTKFYSQKTFKELFQDALTVNQLTLDGLAKEFESIHDSEVEIGSHFGSFVLQHPEHHVVQSIDEPKLSIVFCGLVEKDGTVVIFDESDEWSSPTLKRLAIPTYGVLSPSETVTERVNTLSHQKHASWQGLMFRRIGGFEPETRIRIRTFSYITLRNLRGSEASIVGRFLRVRRQGVLRDYLYNYPKESSAFTELETQFREFTLALYKEYCAVFKEKSKALKDTDIEIRSILWILHGIYLNNCRPANKTMKMPIVISYVNNMSVEEQESLVQYHKAKSIQV